MAVKSKIARKLLGTGGKRKAVRRKATEEGLRFKKKYEAREGAGLASEGGGSVKATRASGTRGEKVTVGKKSYTNFINDQMAIFRGKPDRASVIRRRVLKKITEAEKAGDDAAVKKLRAFANKLEDAGIKKGEAEAAATARKISTTMRGRKKPVDKYGMALKEAAEDGIIESEYTEGLTGPQMEQVMKAARNARKPIGRRIAESGMEEAKLKPGDSAVGRRSGSRGMASGIRAEDRASIKDPINKRAKGGYMKKNKGSMDYRKGGLVMSSVDNRKKR
jgi:hypothetical protein